MRLKQITERLETIAPTRGAESWDNVGLLAGDPEQEVTRALLTIDCTRAVLEERRSLGCELIIAYHPPIFHPLKRLTAGDVVFDAIREGVALFSPHTALDAADGGTNDVLCDVLELTGRGPLRPTETKASRCKLVTFVPEAKVDEVARALFDAGAGRIGNYSSCSFRSPGTGTFRGDAGTNPAVGQSERLESADEIRIETVVPLARVGPVVQALRAAHPYEEPAFDLVTLAAAPEGTGIGRIGEFETPVERAVLFERIRRGLSLEHLLVAGPTDGPVRTAAVCAGACGDLLKDAIARKAELYLTGEVRHHDALAAAEAGVTVVCTLHSNSERATLSRLKRRLEEALPGLACHLSRADRDPFSIR